MKNEGRMLLNILALAFLAVLAYFVYTAATETGDGISITSDNVIENRVAYRYLNKNVLDENSKFDWGTTAEDSAANVVTSVVSDYRLFDTSLEDGNIISLVTNFNDIYAISWWIYVYKWSYFARWRVSCRCNYEYGYISWSFSRKTDYISS